MTIVPVFLFIAIQSMLAAPLTDDLVISLPDGQVRGRTYTTGTNKTYYGFQAIPFAAPPIGNLRFEAPQPPQPWAGVLDATKDGYACITQFNVSSQESEDCLSISVYTPSLQPAEKLPVMLWIYGGKFVVGSNWKSGQDPDYLVDEDVIMVSPNYRVGVFGFLSTGDSAIVGNAGLKDQALAIKWVHDNIEYFGGDPEKVTIFGESAGGASVGLQLVSPKVAGLYRAAIVESGSAITNWTIDLNPKNYVDLLTTQLGGESYLNDTQQIKKFLQEKSVADIENAATKLGNRGDDVPSILDLLPINQAWPVIEVENDDAFLTESPYVLLDSGRFNQVPIIIGICANEAALFLDDLEKIENRGIEMETIPESIIPLNLRQNSSDNDAIIKKIKSLYLKEGETFSSNLLAVTNYQSDTMFTRGVIKQAELTSKYVPVYLYQFAYFGRSIFSYYIPPGAEKASHGAEIPFLFKGTQTSDANDILTQNRMVKLWTNFAKFLNPTPETSELIDVIWPTLSANELQFLNINATLEVRSPIRDNFGEWNNIYDSYGKKPFITF